MGGINGTDKPVQSPPNSPKYSERFKDISELIESARPGECVTTRTAGIGKEMYEKIVNCVASFKGLGPPDMVYVTKTIQNGKNAKEMNSYHFVTGVDTSSSATIAAYVTSLSYSIDNSSGWLRNNPWRISRCKYCTFNAFSGSDVRVEARIPGGVSAYAMSANGNKIPVTTEMWLEVFVSSMLRAIKDDTNYPALRKVNPFTADMEQKFLDAAKKLIGKGWRLGSASGHSVGSKYNNHLIVSILNYFNNFQRSLDGFTFFQNVYEKDLEITSFLSRCLVGAQKEPEAIKRAFNALSVKPTCVTVLIWQSEFLLSKLRIDDALAIAKEAVCACPTDYMVWTNLAKVQIKNKQYSSALISLNKCPLSLAPESETWKISPGTKHWVPKTNECEIDFSSLASITDGNALEQLKGGKLRGAVKVIYDIIAEMVKILGWEEFLLIRSSVFLMEDEFKKDSEVDDTDDSMEQIPLNDNNSINNKENPSAKRMCERWLDSLFMIIFEELRLFTVLQAELVRSRTENIKVQRQPKDWLLFGDLCRRLGYLVEALDAYRQCVETTFSRSALVSQLEIYTEDGKIIEAISAAAKVLLYDKGHFLPSLLPGTVSSVILKLIKYHGLERFKVALVSSQLNQEGTALLKGYMEYAITNRCNGYDY